jgi:hypothetical protein
VVGTRASSPVSMVGAQGVLRTCGDSGDGHDAHDDDIRAYSRQGALLYFVGSLTPSTKRDEPDAKSKESLTYAIFEANSGVGFVQLP